MVETKDDRLFVNAEHRSMPFTITFEHVYDQTKYIAWQSDCDELGNDPCLAEFVFEGEKVTKLGVELELGLDGDLI